MRKLNAKTANSKILRRFCLLQRLNKKRWYTILVHTETSECFSRILIGLIFAIHLYFGESLLN